MSPLVYILGWPLLMAVLLILVPRGNRLLLRAGTLVATFIPMVTALRMFWRFDSAESTAGGYRFVQQIPWIESLGIGFHVGVDGIKRPLDDPNSGSLSMYASFTTKDGNDVLWYPDSKFFLLGKRITKDLLAGLAVPAD